ncbi:transmembrane protein, putative [Rhizoctonia solani AG-3 Rhs1AP]|uniref:Transmembrane protein, putative n=1 Tax=Rhizoctonia solani AG-3 Rhs1AP TaxID=1086054 RepID=A0A0A1ULY1_9AGAM|nr:transmembrane protein, putative [Rhizoctonia solani AG-3 Rhs1AP]
MPFINRQLYEGGSTVHITNIPGNRPEAHNVSRNSQAPIMAAAGNVSPTEDFDEYGTELEPEARVWKTYVKVADKFDKEQVEGWNSSLDVTLIFAGLFTAICTAFVIESAKSLKEDPDETSARRLDQITRILLVIANVSNPESLNSTELAAPISPDPFSPRLVDVCINALWFFSLSLSAAVALLAMLAKEWCYLFMSDRIGDPWSQTKTRQQRWMGIEMWKMEELIMFLPSFIHLSFLSFGIGLCVFLGDLNWRVAILAIIVTLGSMTIYMLSTLLPLLQQHDTICPYSTSISRLIQRFQRRNERHKQDSEETNHVSRQARHDSERTSHIAVEALAWLIKTREDPKSTDTALQAIAGADSNDTDRKILRGCGADTMISRRLTSLDSYSTNYERVLALYTRAHSFFQPPTTSATPRKEASPSSEERGDDTPNPELQESSGAQLQQESNRNQELPKKILRLRKIINEQIDAYVTPRSTRDNIRALWIGRTAASHCLKSLDQGVQPQTEELYDSAIDLLERYRSRDVYLNPQEVQFLMTGIAMLLYFLLVDCTPDAGAQYVVELVRKADTAKSNQEQLRLKYLSLPMVVYALSRHDYPVWPDTSSYHLRSRAQRAVDVVAYYVSQPTPSRLNEVSSTMINLGLLELLADPDIYKLNDGDIKTISEAFDSSAREAPIYTLPSISNTDIYSRSLKGIIKLISKEHHNLLDDDTQDVAIACLTILNRIPVVQWTVNSSFEQVYAFVIECVLKIPPSGPESYGQNTALDLMQKFHDRNDLVRAQNPMPDLAQWLNRREIFTKLKEAAEMQATSNDPNFVTKLFATGQAWVLIDFAVKSKTTDQDGWRSCLSFFVQDENLWDSSDPTILRFEDQRTTLANQYRGMWGDRSTHCHKYLKSLYESLALAGPEHGNLLLANTPQSFGTEK